jgi:peroxiredoxin
VKNLWLWIILATGILGIAGCRGVMGPGSAERTFAPMQKGIAEKGVTEGSAVGNVAPDFSLQNLSGKAVKLRGERDKQPVTMLIFWATWCGFCRRDLPSVGKFFNEYSRLGVRVLSISIDKGGTNVSSFVKAAGINFPVLLDKNSSIASKYRLRSIPNVLVIDSSGIVRYNGHSTADAKRTVDSILEAATK